MVPDPPVAQAIDTRPHPVTMDAPSEVIHSERHTCGRVLIMVRPAGIQLKCHKCGEEVLYSWRKILTFQLLAWA